MSDDPAFVEFLDSHRPPLTAGEYKISVQQDISKESLITSDRIGRGEWRFTIAGPQFSLSPQEIAAVFPPAGSLGDHSTVFPHVALHRSTLPWERSGDQNPNDEPGKWTEAATPWLALLVYDEGDLASKEIRIPTADNTALPLKELDVPDASYELPKGAALESRVAAVDVKTASLGKFIPSAMECRLLCHVRRNILFSIPRTDGQEPKLADFQGKFPEAARLSAEVTIARTGEQGCWRLVDTQPARRSFLLWEYTSENSNNSEKSWQVTDEDDAEYAFVIGNRLPTPEKSTSVHLISLEQRFAPGADHIVTSAKDYTRFVSLHQWRFSCESHEHTFTRLLQNLNQPIATDAAVPPTDRLATLRLPRNQDGPTELRLALGFTLMPHQFRNGSQSYSWYRGPLAPGPTRIQSLPLPAKSSDALLAYDQTSGLFDTSYAAAWELGRLLCVANSRISQALFQWKREDRRMRRHLAPDRQKKNALLPVEAPSSPQDESNTNLPQVVADWFESLRKLEPVPFRYLVPDERMLPVESIRFFEIDPYWINCLVDGAFSIGRVLESDHVHDRDLHAEHSGSLRPIHKTENRVTGLLLRSAVVSGWPLMTVDAVSGPSAKRQRHERLRFDRLAPDILLCLFAGSPTRFEVHLPRETIHFGAKSKNKIPFLPETLTKLGVALTNGLLSLEMTPPAELDPAEFARLMIQGVPKVSFERPVTG